MYGKPQLEGAVSRSSNDDDAFVRPPQLSLPKGGGAIRGIGEKFAANPVTGTGSMTVPIATSPGRSGFGPQLSLSYDSGAGNGPFGFGWSLSLPSITRKTDKGLPRYRDAEESRWLHPVRRGETSSRFCILTVTRGRTREPLHRAVDGRSIACDATARGSRAFRAHRALDQQRRCTAILLAIDLQGQRHDLVRQDGREPDRRSCRSHSHLQLADLRELRRQGQRRGLRIQGRRREASTQRKPRSAIALTQSRSANRYLKRIRYGNHVPYLPRLAWDAPWPALPGRMNGISSWSSTTASTTPRSPTPVE